MNVINIQEQLETIDKMWTPKIAGELNDQHVKLTKLDGEFVMHHHDHEDELFLVIQGTLHIEFADTTKTIRPGEFIIIPRGIEHKPIAYEEVHIMLFEPATTLNTGNVNNERTVSTPERIDG